MGDILKLPFPAEIFDKVVSITALEFVAEARAAIDELFRVTRRGGCVVVATLNSLSPWATRRKEEARKGHKLFQKAIFRSPDELLSLAPVPGIAETAIHFQKDDDPRIAAEIESEGRRTGFEYRSIRCCPLAKAVVGHGYFLHSCIRVIQLSQQPSFIKRIRNPLVEF